MITDAEYELLKRVANGEELPRAYNGSRKSKDFKRAFLSLLKLEYICEIDGDVHLNPSGRDALRDETRHRHQEAWEGAP